MKNVIEEDLSLLLKDIRARTLVIWGENDEVTPLADAHFMKAEILDSELRVIKGAGHSAHKKEPQEFAGILLDFLRKNK